jgi:hypothetical protein
MAQQIAAFVPAGFIVERTAVEADRVVLSVRAKAIDCNRYGDHTSSAPVAGSRLGQPAACGAIGAALSI